MKCTIYKCDRCHLRIHNPSSEMITDREQLGNGIGEPYAWKVEHYHTQCYDEILKERSADCDMEYSEYDVLLKELDFVNKYRCMIESDCSIGKIYEELNNDADRIDDDLEDICYSC